VLPLIACVVVLLTQAIMLAISTSLMIGNGLSPSTLWSRWPGATMSTVMFYGVAAHALWFAPMYCWFLLVSAWARRAAILWALLPFFAVYSVEHIAFGTKHFSSFIKYRFGGAMLEAFSGIDTNQAVTRFHQLSPMKFLTSPGLWFGLVFAGACIAAAARLRRNREPM
jgi:ABC-2 type transport system permease protein